jgi:excisionase family DNA binding protein
MDEPEQPVIQRAYCSLKEAGTYLGVSEKTIRALVAQGQLRAKKVGAQYRIKLTDLEDQLNVPVF